MTAKEKAKELIDKFAPYTWSGASFIGIEELEMTRDNPKECALIFVDEMINNAGFIWGGKDSEIGLNARDAFRKYWQEVKQEIEKLSTR